MPEITSAQLFDAALVLYPFTFPTKINCEARAVQTDGTPLRGAAKASFMKKCVADSDRFGGTRIWSTLPYEGLLFEVRGFSNGNHLGVASNGHVYGLGPYTDGALVDFGALQSFAEAVCGVSAC